MANGIDLAGHENTNAALSPASSYKAHGIKIAYTMSATWSITFAI